MGLIRVAAGTRSVLRWWKRMILGALAAWIIVNVALIAAIVYTESRGIRYPDQEAVWLAYVLLVVSWPIGAAIALHLRPRD